MKRKLTKSVLQNRSNIKHNNEYLILGEYIDKDSKILTRHLKCGYEWKMNFYNHVGQGKGCPKCAGNIKISQSEFIEKSNKIHNNEFELLSKFTNTKSDVILKHICGHIFRVKCYNHLYGETGCPKCKGGVKLTNCDIQIRLDEVYNGDFTIIDYNGYYKISTFIHNKCGSELKVATSNILHENTKCTCEGNVRWNEVIFLERQKEIFGNEYKLIDGFVNMSHRIKIKHNKCGNIWIISPKKHIYSKQGCPICNMSHGERMVKMVLDKLNINHEIQYTIDKCKNIRKLPFDFFLTELNACIEYDGIQHFEPVKRFGGESEFTKRKINDSIKNNYCKDNNIKLIRIPYWDLDNIQEILNDELL